MPRPRTGLNVATRKLPDGTVERRWYYKPTGAFIGSSRDGMTQSRAAAIVRALETETPKEGPRPGSFEWLAAAYRASPRFEKKAKATRRHYGASLDLLIARWGLRHAEGLTRADVTTLLGEMKDKPWQANAHVRVLRLIYNWGRRELGLRCANPADAPEMHRTAPRTAIWDAGRITAFLDAAAPQEALAMALLLYTVQRPADVLAFERGQVIERDGRLWLLLRQQKTGEFIAVPCHRDLEARLRARLVEMDEGEALARAGAVVDPRIATHLLVPAPGGGAWKYRAFAASWDRTRARVNWRIARETLRAWGGMPPRSRPKARAEAKAGLLARMLVGLQRRDLRRTGMVMMALAGATIAHIAALSGHSIDQTSKIIETYIPRRGDVALAGMELWEAGGTRALALLPGPARAIGATEGVSSAPTSAESGALETQSEKQTGNKRKR